MGEIQKYSAQETIQVWFFYLNKSKQYVVDAWQKNIVNVYIYVLSVWKN